MHSTKNKMKQHAVNTSGSIARSFRLSPVALALVALGASQGALAANINVASAAELVAAITQANEHDDADTITLNADIELAVRDNTTTGHNGLPVIRSDITIAGNGHALTRAPGAPTFRFIEVGADGGLTLTGITLSGGVATTEFDYSLGDFFGSGGAVLNAGGNLTIDHVTLSGNSAESNGGAVANFSDGVLYVADSTFDGNKITTIGKGDGGAIINEGAYAVILRGTFQNNEVDTLAGDGGAIENSSGWMTVTDSGFIGNLGYCGGAIENAYGYIKIANSNFTNNTATLHAGAIYASPINTGNGVRYLENYGSGLIDISDSTITGNHAPGKYAGGVLVAAEGGGGIYVDYGIVALKNTTVSGNTVPAGYPVDIGVGADKAANSDSMGTPATSPVVVSLGGNTLGSLVADYVSNGKLQYSGVSTISVGGSDQSLVLAFSGSLADPGFQSLLVAEDDSETPGGTSTTTSGLDTQQPVSTASAANSGTDASNSGGGGAFAPLALLFALPRVMRKTMKK